MLSCTCPHPNKCALPNPPLFSSLSRELCPARGKLTCHPALLSFPSVCHKPLQSRPTPLQHLGIIQ